MVSRRPDERIDRSRTLRRKSTEAEKVLWRHLRANQLGAKFRRQHPFDPFVLDFYCHEAKLAVELDGGGHAETGQMEHDRQRDRFLQENGIQVMRIWDGDALKNVQGVLEAIRQALTPALSQREREKI